MLAALTYLIFIFTDKVKDEARKDIETTLHNYKENVDKITVDKINPALKSIGADEMDPSDGSNKQLKTVENDNSNEPLPEDVVRLKKENEQLKKYIKIYEENLLRQDKELKKQKEELKHLEDYIDDIPVLVILLLTIPVLTILILVAIFHFFLFKMYLPIKI